MKKKLIVLSSFVLGLSLVPFVAFADCVTTATDITVVSEVLCKVGEIFSAAIPVIITLGIIYFVWGVVSYVIGDSEEAKKKGKDRMIYGIIGLAIIVGMWGVVKILTETFGVTDSNNANIFLPGIGGKVEK
jgi:hypothetical protein